MPNPSHPIVSTTPCMKQATPIRLVKPEMVSAMVRSANKQGIRTPHFVPTICRGSVPKEVLEKHG
jgi:hypothetical protein